MGTKFADLDHTYKHTRIDLELLIILWNKHEVKFT
jgi:hypothetical protein